MDPKHLCRWSTWPSEIAIATWVIPLDGLSSGSNFKIVREGGGVVSLGLSPTMKRRQLGGELRRLRQAAGLTLEAVRKELYFSESKISRIGTGRIGQRPTTSGECSNSTKSARNSELHSSRPLKRLGEGPGGRNMATRPSCLWLV
jgi:hypothetical protein